MRERLSPAESFWKRLFDLAVSAAGLAISLWLILLAWIAASIDSKSNGLFFQQRVGKHGKLFSVIKIKTMRCEADANTTITAENDPRITRLGAFFRTTKIDELPQLINVLLGQMSLVGPRPDVPGYADRLRGDERIILNVRPGITGPATLKYKNEEKLLASKENPQEFNDQVIFPDKVKINMDYIANYSFKKDLQYIFQTLFG